MNNREPRRVEVAKDPTRKKLNTNTRDLLATLCYYYPQYTLRQARNLPYRDVILLLKIARRNEAIRYANMVEIVAAPHFSKGVGVKKLQKRFADIIDKS